MYFPPTLYQITPYVGLYDPKPRSHEALTWPQVVGFLSNHQPYPKKESTPGFGAHSLSAYGRRRIEDVKSVSLFVFDVDKGSAQDVLKTEDLLRQENQAAHFYSSYSYTPDHPTPPFRLVIPPNRPVLPEEYDTARTAMIRRFSIPCDPDKCSSVAHFWFLPSHPHGQHGLTETLDGHALNVDTLLASAPPAPRLRPKARSAPSQTYVPPQEPDPAAAAAVDLTPLRSAVKRHAARVKKQGDPRKAEYLRRLLAGEPLAEHGDRNHALFVATGSVTWICPDTPLSYFVRLFTTSLEAMMSAGSKLTYDTLERMLLTGMEGKAAQDEEFEAFKTAVKLAKEQP